MAGMADDVRRRGGHAADRRSRRLGRVGGGGAAASASAAGGLRLRTAGFGSAGFGFGGSWPRPACASAGLRTRRRRFGAARFGRRARASRCAAFRLSPVFRRLVRVGGAAGAEFSRAVVSVGFSVFSDFSCGRSVCLPWLECCRYCLPNFPHSPAGYGRERQRLHAFLADGAQAALFFRLIQLIGLGGDHQIRPAVDPRATASGPDLSPSIRGGYPESGRKASRSLYLSKYSSISFFQSCREPHAEPGRNHIPGRSTK